MGYAFLDFTGTAWFQNWSADVSAGTTGNVHLGLIGIAAVRALPNQLVAFVLNDFDFAGIAAFTAVVGFGVELGIHDVVINMLDERHNRLQVVLHVRYFDVGDGSARDSFWNCASKVSLSKASIGSVT